MLIVQIKYSCQLKKNIPSSLYNDVVVRINIPLRENDEIEFSTIQFWSRR
jgi:hypothetical protein